MQTPFFAFPYHIFSSSRKQRTASSQCTHLIGQERFRNIWDIIFPAVFAPQKSQFTPWSIADLALWFGILCDAPDKHLFEIEEGAFAITSNNQNSKKLILQSVKSWFSYTSLIHPHAIFHSVAQIRRTTSRCGASCMETNEVAALAMAVKLRNWGCKRSNEWLKLKLNCMIQIKEWFPWFKLVLEFWLLWTSKCMWMFTKEVLYMIFLQVGSWWIFEAKAVLSQSLAYRFSGLLPIFHTRLCSNRHFCFRNNKQLRCRQQRISWVWVPSDLETFLVLCGSHVIFCVLDVDPACEGWNLPQRLWFNQLTSASFVIAKKSTAMLDLITIFSAAGLQQELKNANGDKSISDFFQTFL